MALFDPPDSAPLPFLPAFYNFSRFHEVFTLADWLAPFHMPKFTDEEYGKRKSAYVASHGYTVTIPGLDDIFHWGVPKPLTEQEAKDWKNKNQKGFSEKRWDEIKKMKQKRKERYLAMLASPTPEVVTNAGSVLTALDDAQDCISTIAFIGRVAAKIAPRFLAKAFFGPLGWLLLANDIINLIVTLGQIPTVGLMGKRISEKAFGSNPFAKKAKVARAIKMRKWRPTKGDIIQALQTTDQVFGYGISLGPIVGMFQDIFSMAVRTNLGQPVKIKWPWGSPPPFIMPAYRSLKSITTVMSSPNIVDDEIMQECLLANYFANQAIQPYAAEWNPLDQVEDLDNTRILCPVPANPLTLEIIEEEGIPLSQVVGWPHSGKPWASPGEISDETASVATSNLKSCIKRNEHNWFGHAMGALACEASTYQLANLEGESDVRVDYTAQAKIALSLLAQGYSLASTNSSEKFNEFADFMNWSEKNAATLKGFHAIEFCQDRGIALTRTYPT